MVLVLCSPAWGLAEVPKTVDPDNGGGTDYTSLDAWEDALGGTTSGDLPSDDQIAVAECRSSSGTDDTTAVQINGWTTDATRYIKITGAGTDGDWPNTGILDTTKYVRTITNAASIDIRENYVRVEKIQIVVTETGTSNAYGMYIAVQDAGNDIRVDSCIIQGVCSGTGNAYGVVTDDADIIAKIFNNISYGFISGGDTGFYGFRASNSSAVDFYNNTASGCYYGIGQSNGTVNAINGAVFNNTDDFVGTITITNCATDQGAGEGTNGVDISGTWDSTCFTAPEATPPDFSVQDVDSPVYNTGDGTTPKAVFTADIINTTRGPADGDWDIGAFEYVAPPAGGGQVIIIKSAIPLILIITLASVLSIKKRKE